MASSSCVITENTYRNTNLTGQRLWHTPLNSLKILWSELPLRSLLLAQSYCTPLANYSNILAPPRSQQSYHPFTLCLRFSGCVRWWMTWDSIGPIERFTASTYMAKFISSTTVTLERSDFLLSTHILLKICLRTLSRLWLSAHLEELIFWSGSFGFRLELSRVLRLTRGTVSTARGFTRLAWLILMPLPTTITIILKTKVILGILSIWTLSLEHKMAG